MNGDMEKVCPLVLSVALKYDVEVHLIFLHCNESTLQGYSQHEGAKGCPEFQGRRWT